MSTTSYKISVKAPCHEDWAGMSNTNDGRFCSSCEKEVIDFTKLSDEEVIAYIQKNAKHGGCGRFLNTQLETITINFEENTFDTSIAFWKKFVAVLMMCFAQQIFNAQVAFTQTPKNDSAIVKPICDSDMMIESPPISYLDSVLKSIKMDSALSYKDSTMVKDSTIVKDSIMHNNDSQFTTGGAVYEIKLTNIINTKDYEWESPKKIDVSSICYPINKCDIVGFYVPIQTIKEIPQISIEPTSILYPKYKKKSNENSFYENKKDVDFEKKNEAPKEENDSNLPIIAILPNDEKKKKK